MKPVNVTNCNEFRCPQWNWGKWGKVNFYTFSTRCTPRWSLILKCLLLFSVLTSVSANVKLCVKIIVVKVVISVLLKWSRINPNLVVTLDGELCGNQYEIQFFYFLFSVPFDRAQSARIEQMQNFHYYFEFAFNFMLNLNTNLKFHSARWHVELVFEWESQSACDSTLDLLKIHIQSRTARASIPNIV